jgi:hypothetical protein
VARTGKKSTDPKTLSTEQWQEWRRNPASLTIESLEELKKWVKSQNGHLECETADRWPLASEAIESLKVHDPSAEASSQTAEKINPPPQQHPPTGLPSLRKIPSAGAPTTGPG